MAHEGAKIKELLERAGKTQSDLARACGVSATAASRYLKPARLGKIAWPRCRVGLVKLGIDPAKIRPNDQIVEEERQDLRPLVAQFNRSQLDAIRTILQAQDMDREKLLYWIDGVLHLKS